MKPELLKKVNEINPEALSRSKELGEAFHFQNEVSLIEDAKDLLLRLHVVQDRLPSPISQGIERLASDLLAVCAKIQTMQPAAAHTQHQSLKNAVREVVDEVRSYRPHLLALEADAQSVAEQTRRLNELMAKIEAREREAQQAAAGAKAAAGITAAAEWVKDYEVRAARLQRQSNLWYGVAIIWAVLGVSLVVIYLWLIGRYHLQESQSQQQQPFNLGTSIVFLAGVAVAGSLYHLSASFARSYRHLAEMARHRAVVGRTYESFYGNADEKTKPAVLLAVLSTLVAPDRTGFIKREGETGEETIVESATRFLGKGP